MNNKFGIEFTSQSKGLINQINKLSNSMEGLGKAGRRTSGDFRKFQKETRKLNDMFSNLHRDGNRTTKVIKGMKAPLFSVGNAIKGVMAYKISNYLYTATRSAMDMIETTHLFEVSMGSLAVETDNVVKSLNELSGLDVGNLRDRIGTFNMLGLTMGFAEKNAQTLALGMNQLALDMGALFNVPYQQIAEDLRSGLIGQSRTLYKYGLDVTEAAIANEALALGISKSVRHMTQGEKMMLRYSVLIKQASRFQGDFAETFNTPMNQLRILQERFVTLSRTIGRLFIPMMGKIVVVANAVAIALTRVIRLIGGFFNIDMDSHVKNMEDGFSVVDDELNDGLDKAGNKIKKIKRSLMGFDELNILQDLASGGSDSKLDLGGGSPLDLDLEVYDALLDGINDKAKEIADEIMEIMKNIWEIAEPTREALSKLWNEGLAQFGGFTIGTLKDFYNNFLVPVGSWVLGEDGIPKLVLALNDLLNAINWDKLSESLSKFYKAVARFTIGVGKGLIEFVKDLIKFLTPAIVKLLDLFGISLDGLSDALNNIPEDKLEKLGYDLGLLTTAILGFKGAKKVLDWLVNIVTNIKTTLSNLSGFSIDPTTLVILASPILEGITNWVREHAPDWAVNLLDILSDALTGMSIGGVIGAWFGPAGMIGGAIIGGIIGASFEGVKSYFSKVKEKFESEWEVLKPVIEEIPKFITEKFTNARDNVKEVFSNVGGWAKDKVDGIKEVFVNIDNWFKEKFEKAWENIGTAFKNTKTWASDRKKDIEDGFKDMDKWFKEKFDKAWTNITTAFKDSKNWVKEKYNDITTQFSNIPEWFRDKFQDAWDKIKSVFRSVGDWFKERYDDIVRPFENIGDWFKQKFEDAWNNVKNPFSGAKGWAGDVVRDIKDSFSGIPKWFGDLFSDAWDNVTGFFGNIGEKVRGVGSSVTNKFGVSNYSIPTSPIPQLAGGGVLDMGQMFIAREAGAELVGNFGGKTGVMNNDQIIDAVSRGVYDAVRSALGNSNTNQDGGVIVQIGERTILDTLQQGVNRETRINGKSVIRV